MVLSSPAFEDNQTIPSQYTCSGGDKSPPLSIAHIPEATQSLALILDDPDAVRGVFTHWIVWNIPSTIETIEENTLPPDATTGTNSYGNTRYSGPCPPSGKHRYLFKMYALDTKLDLPESTTKPELEQAMATHILSQTTLTGFFEKK